MDNAHVAQLDNAPDYGSGRWRFESFRARHCTILRDIQRCRRRFAVGHTTKGPDIIKTGAQLEQIAPFEMMKNAKNLPVDSTADPF
jgi:hypothetical protein